MTSAPQAATPDWTPASWRSRPVDQPPGWPDETAAAGVGAALAGLPPLVFAGEADRLGEALAEAAAGRAFVLTGGDCAESFGDARADTVRAKLRVMLQMAVVLTYAAGVPVVKVGRMAGQFAKPRSSATEVVDGVEMPSFRGDMVNSERPDPDARRPDPARMLTAYNVSAATLNLLRAHTTGGFADLREVHSWNQEFVAASPGGRRYEALAGEIDRALRFMAASGLPVSSAARSVEFWTAHEALVLDYEQALTRRDSRTGRFYDCSAHLLWVGERTRRLDGAHIEFLSGVANPVGVKVGPTASPAEVAALCARLDPQRRPGRLSVICRMGAAAVASALPAVIDEVRAAGHPVVWVCDPMHANTITGGGGRKTRRFGDIAAEVEGFFAACQQAGVTPGGLHLELTGDDVTECLGGTDEVLADHLAARYTTACDPRLNASQSLDLAFEVAELLRANT